MTGNIPPRFAHGCRCFRIAFKRAGDGKNRARDVSPGKHPVQAPESGPAAVHEHAFGRQVAAHDGGGRPFRKRRLGSRVTVRHGILAPFFVVDHEIDGDMRAIRPARIRRLATVTDEVSRASRLRIIHVWFSHDLVAPPQQPSASTKLRANETDGLFRKHLNSLTVIAWTRRISQNCQVRPHRALAMAGGWRSRSSRPQPAFAPWASARQPSFASRANAGAGEGNRTLVFSLEGCCSTIELHPRQAMT